MEREIALYSPALPERLGALVYADFDWLESNSTLYLREYFGDILHIEWGDWITHYSPIENGQAVRRFHTTAHKLHYWFARTAAYSGLVDDDMRISRKTKENKFTLQYLQGRTPDCLTTFSTTLR